ARAPGDVQLLGPFVELRPIAVLERGAGPPSAGAASGGLLPERPSRALRQLRDRALGAGGALRLADVALRGPGLLPGGHADRLLVVVPVLSFPLAASEETSRARRGRVRVRRRDALDRFARREPPALPAGDRRDAAVAERAPCAVDVDCGRTFLDAEEDDVAPRRGALRALHPAVPEGLEVRQHRDAGDEPERRHVATPVVPGHPLPDQ